MIPGGDLLEGILPTRADLDALGIPVDPNIVGLFEGYGGLTLGVEAVTGGNLIAYSEIERTAIKLLEAHFPGIPNLGDVSVVDWRRVVEEHGGIDIMLGGFPCQDVSHAGLGKGIQVGTRSGLWYQFARAIDETRPALVVIENVRGLRSAPAGLKDEWTDEDDELLAAAAEGYSGGEPDPWDVGQHGRVDRPVLRALGAVLLDLAELGYLAAWDSVRASDVGAAHRRERVFIHAVPD